MAGRRRAAVAVVLIGVAAAAIAAALIVLRLTTANADAASAAPPLPTVEVTRGDMVAATNVKGTLHFSGAEKITAGPSGVLTALPVPGSTISTGGGVLYEVNDAPVVLLRGDLPAWRSFEVGMSDGDDVQQLEQNLAGFGMFDGDVDRVFTWRTADAIERWQRSIGAEQTGRVERSAIRFESHDLRVAQWTAAVGAAVGDGVEVFQATATDKVVDLGLDLDDQRLAVPQASVTVVLPDGTSTPGVVSAVGQPTQQGADPDDAGGAPAVIVPVSVTVVDPAAVEAYPQAQVTVQFASTLATDALTVPVEALVAIDATTFAVEVPSDDADDPPRRIPVELGAFSAGRVAITGDGIAAGTVVIVPDL